MPYGHCARSVTSTKGQVWKAAFTKNGKGSRHHLKVQKYIYAQNEMKDEDGEEEEIVNKGS